MSLNHKKRYQHPGNQPEPNKSTQLQPPGQPTRPTHLSTKTATGRPGTWRIRLQLASGCSQSKRIPGTKHLRSSQSFTVLNILFSRCLALIVFGGLRTTCNFAMTRIARQPLPSKMQYLRMVGIFKLKTSDKLSCLMSRPNRCMAPFVPEIP